MKPIIDLYCSDNLNLMNDVPDNTIDLIYCDILYGTGRNFGDYQDLKPIRSEIESHYIPRIKEMHRILKPTGSIYLQMDTRINHWMRCIMDDIFGYKNFQNEIAWVYRAQGFSRTKWSEKHDVVLFYSKTKNFTFNLEDVRENEIGESTQKRWHKEIAEHGLMPTKKNGKVYWKSLTLTCMKCHDDKEKFCDKCHDSVAVTPYCWDCHVQPPKGEE